MEKANLKIIGLATAGTIAIVRLRRGRAEVDPAHAAGHRHLGPPPESEGGKGRERKRFARNQPWIRRSHSDSQQRRFRR